jgi:hypothetical protein
LTSSSNTSSHAHYSKEVQNALADFREVYEKVWSDSLGAARAMAFTERGPLMEAAEQAFFRLVRLRREETGCGGYLGPDEYVNRTSKHTVESGAEY